MAILWGVDLRRETRGIVIDLCAQCSGIQPHWLCDSFSAMHMNHVSLDRGMYAFSSVVCGRCSMESEVGPDRFTDALPADTSVLPLERMLQRTNPELALALTTVDSARRAGTPEPSIAEIEALLFSRVDVRSLIQRLAKWNALSDAERAAVAEAIHDAWMCAGGPERPTQAIQPGMAGWATPQREASMLRAIDRKFVAMVAGALCFIGLILAFIAALE
jgi:hypothetical protein